MSDFLILGLVPGTHIQITFVLWLFGASALASLVVMHFIRRAHLVRNGLITTWVMLAARRQPHLQIIR